MWGLGGFYCVRGEKCSRCERFWGEVGENEQWSEEKIDGEGEEIWEDVIWKIKVLVWKETVENGVEGEEEGEEEKDMDVEVEDAEVEREVGNADVEKGRRRCRG
jgi:hypothetical protein